MPRFSELLRNRTNYVLIGETGSGKSEIALNIATLLSRRGERNVHVFDLDQTKAMFRARDAEAEMAALGVTVHYMPQLLDTPVLVGGIIPHLRRKDSFCVLDVGGNENAARMVGCLSDHLNGENTAVLYVLNPYRPWSGSRASVEETMASVLNASHLEQIVWVANPTVGRETGREETEEGLRMLKTLIPAEELAGIFIREDLLPAERLPHRKTNLEPEPEMIPLHPYLGYPWTT